MGQRGVPTSTRLRRGRSVLPPSTVATLPEAFPGSWPAGGLRDLANTSASLHIYFLISPKGTC